MLLVLLAAGCGSSETARDPERPIVIEYWHQPMVSTVPGLDAVREPGDFERLLADEFEDSHPGIEVRTQCLNWEDLPRKVPISVLGGRPPDVLMDFVGRTSGFWYQGVLEPLDELIEDDRDDFQPSILAEFELPDRAGDLRLHAVPLCGWVQVLAINRAAWDVRDLGDLLPSREDPRWKSFAQFERALEAVARPDECWPLGMQVASEQGDYCVLQFFWAFGAEVYHDRDYSRVAINSPQGIAALEWLVKAKQRGWIQPNVATAGNSLYDMFWRGDIVCLPAGVTMRRTYEAALAEDKVVADFDDDGEVDFDIMFTLPPSRPGVPVSLPYGSNGLVVFRQDDPARRNAIFKFVRFMTRSKVIGMYSRASNFLPARKSVGNVFAGQPDVDRVSQLAAACRTADMGTGSPYYYDLRKRLPPYLQAAFLGLKTPAEALAGFERESQLVLGEARPR